MRLTTQASDGVQRVEDAAHERVRASAGSRREHGSLGQIQPLEHFSLQELVVCLADDTHARAVRDHVASHLLAVDANHAVGPVRVNVDAASTLRTLVDTCHLNTSLVYCTGTRNELQIELMCSGLMNRITIGVLVSNSIQKSPRLRGFE